MNKTQKINGLRKGLLILLMLFLSFWSLKIGVETMKFNEILDKETLSHTLFFYTRLPRTLAILIAGFGIGISGLIFQQISRNKFVSPTTSGSVSGAQLGIAIMIAFIPMQNTFVMMLFAFVASLLVSLVFMGILKRLKFKELIYVPLLGMMLSGVVSSVTTFIAYRYNFLQVLQGWFYGSFSLVTSGRYELLYLIIIPVALAFFYAKAFTIVSVGQNFATNLGLNYDRIVQIGVLITSVVSACIVVVIGSVPFLGLVVPNIVSIYAGDNLEKNILDVGLMGINILLVSDLISRLLIYPYELPIAMVVGVLGTSFFLLTLLRRGGQS